MYGTCKSKMKRRERDDLFFGLSGILEVLLSKITRKWNSNLAK